VEFDNFTIDIDCDFYHDFEKLFIEKGKDVSDSKLTFNGHQFDVIGSKFINWKKLKDWTLSKVRHKKIEDIEILKAWCIDYYDNGYQAFHRHNNGGISVVISLDDQPKENKIGTLYTLTPGDQNGTIHKEYKPHKGRTIIMTGGVWHGVYPGKNPRRTFVADYKIKGEKSK
jgi:hypothetical protein